MGHPPLGTRAKGRRRAEALPLAVNLEIGRLASRVRRVRGGTGLALLGFGGELLKHVLAGLVRIVRDGERYDISLRSVQAVARFILDRKSVV